MPKFEVAGGEIYFEEAGRGHPLIFISGLNGVGRYWEPQIPVFSAHYRVVTYDQRAGLSRIKAPTLVTASDDDFITPRYFSEALARAIPEAKLVIRCGGGHSSTKTRAEEFNRDLREFLGASA